MVLLIFSTVESVKLCYCNRSSVIGDSGVGVGLLHMIFLVIVQKIITRFISSGWALHGSSIIMVYLSSS